jgi:pimeloyl-ACP methyl ester carboxylesterase
MKPIGLFLVFWLVVPSPTRAGNVTLEVGKGLIANAEYRPGDQDKPALLLLHGFLQTHKFHTVHQLTESLGDDGYTVLAPTLSLNIPYRSSSQPCEAIQTHTMEESTREIDQWVQWLLAKGHGNILLIGHSTGSMRLLAYTASQRRPEIRSLIAVSLVEGRINLDPEGLDDLTAKLRAQIASGDKQLTKHQLSFCKAFNAAPASLLSYAEWTPDRILKTIADSHLPMHIIMGGNDNRLGKHWIESLRATGKPVHVIDGANHFMDGQHEFDVLEIIQNLLKDS